MAGQLVQYIVVRADLLKTLNWPVGSVIAQACHACCAVTYLYQNDPYTQEYLKDLDNMHKVVLEVPDESSLRNLESQLKENSVLHKMWIEQPEYFPTCIAVKPYPKEEVQKYFKKLRLFKGIGIHIHMTTYQVHNERHPWIHKEEKAFDDLLRRTIEKLKQRIMEEIAAIPEHMTRRVMENLRESLEQCLRSGGGHLRDEICKTQNGMY